MASNDTPFLSLRGISAGYRRRPVIFDVSLEVNAGEMVAVLGHNGAGKTTTIKTVFGLVKPLEGSVFYDGEDISRCSPAERVRRGISFTPAEQFVFPDLSVAENLRLGALTEPSREVRRRQVDMVHEMFPILQERSDQMAGTFSGGQQRILSIGIALMSSPKLLLLDEPSLGVSPAITQQILNALSAMCKEEGRSVVLLEQNVGYALSVSERVYVMRSGRILLEETAEAMNERESLWDLF